MTLDVNATPNVPDCVVKANSDIQGTAQFTYNEVGNSTIDAGTSEAVPNDDLLTYDYQWALPDLSGLLESEYSGTVTLATESQTVDWTQPPIPNDIANTEVDLADIALSRIARISSMYAIISDRGECSIEDFAELKRLVKSITWHGTLVGVDSA